MEKMRKDILSNLGKTVCQNSPFWPTLFSNKKSWQKRAFSSCILSEQQQPFGKKKKLQIPHPIWKNPQSMGNVWHNDSIKKKKFVQFLFMSSLIGIKEAVFTGFFTLELLAGCCTLAVNGGGCSQILLSSFKLQAQTTD